MLHKVLIVDDSELIHQMYRLVMLRYNCRFGDAMNGQEALDILKLQHDFQLILLDINMPVMNGVQFMEQATLLGISRRIPVIAVGTEGKEQETMLVMKLGAKGSLLKPFNSGALYSLIEKIVPSPIPHPMYGASSRWPSAQAH